MKSATFLAALATLLPAYVAGQAAEYGQCGGTGWTGATTCVSGTTCTVLNPYYSQCLPGSAASSASSHSSSVSSVSSHSSSVSSAPSTGPSGTPAPTANNPWTGYETFLSPYYTSEIQAAAKQITDPTLAAKAASVANIPTFTWLDSVSKIPSLGTYLANASALGKSTGTKQLVQIVVYDLPGRDCAAAASAGEFSIADNGQANYENYIDQIVTLVQQYPDVRVVAVIEPDSLANLVTNLSVQKCSEAQTTYLACVNYALVNLAKAGVYMYIDAGHAGWLGWPANLSPAAQLFTQVWSNAGKSPFIKGLATDVSNYNALSTSTPDPITQGNPNYDELLYISALQPLLQQQGWDATFVVDQGRSGVQGIRQAWGDWCNVAGAGFGTRPTTNTGSAFIDSIVWVKPGGEADGTSNSSSPRYDPNCSKSDALQPAPEAGTWFQTYFQTLVSSANPPL